jgi:hypothetical protein
VRIQVHGIVQNAANLHDAGFAEAVEQEVPGAADPIASSTRRLAAKEQMIGSELSAISGRGQLPASSGFSATSSMAVAMSFPYRLKVCGPKFSSVQARMLAMSLRAAGAMMTAIRSPALVGRFGPDLGVDLANELLYGFLAFEENALSLIDFIEALSGCLPKRSQLRLAFLLLFFQKAQSLADDLARVAVAPGGNLALDELVQMFRQIDVARWHARFLSPPF